MKLEINSTFDVGDKVDFVQAGYPSYGKVVKVSVVKEQVKYLVEAEDESRYWVDRDQLGRRTDNA